MQLHLESTDPEDYLEELPPVIVFDIPVVQDIITSFRFQTSSKTERAKLAFEFARDEIQHSFDTNSKLVTIGASETIQNREGICFAKAHLLASLLRAMDIPCGFCYQRVLRKGTIASGYALHGLNAVYLEDTGWFRVDPRGNKPGINSQFSTEKEQLAYPIREELGEVDYPEVFLAPLPSVIKAMQTSPDCQALFFNRPETI